MVSSDDEPEIMMTKNPAAFESRLCLMMARTKLPPDVYNEFIMIMKEISPASECGISNSTISIERCIQKAMKLLQGHTEFRMYFQRFTEGHRPFLNQFQRPMGFIMRLKASGITEKDYNAFLNALQDFDQKKITSKEDLYQKMEGLLGTRPEFLLELKAFLFHHLRVPSQDEQSCRSPKSCMQVRKVVLSSTPDANHRPDVIRHKATNRIKKSSQLECPSDQNHDGKEYTVKKKHSQDQKPTKKGHEEPPPPTIGDLPEEDKEDKVEPLPDWSPSREKQLPPQVDLSISAPHACRYCLLPDNCATLQSSYWTELGRSVLNDVLTCVTSGGSEEFKCRTINQYEENIFKCEDVMSECDMLLERFKATDKFIGNLLDHAGGNAMIDQEHLTPLHRRCIEQIYGDYGLVILDSLLGTKSTSAVQPVLAVLHSRIKQKIETFSKARSELVKKCTNIVANNHKRSLDHGKPPPNNWT